MDAAERRRVFARAVERASARRRPSKAITSAMFADAVARARQAGIRTQSVTPDAWDATIERAMRRTATK